METINELSDFLIIAIRTGALMRLVYCFVRIGTSAEEEQPQYRKRLRNTLVFYILAELVWVMKDLIINYFG